MSPLLTGIVSAGGAIVVLLVGAWLFRVVAPDQRKAVAVALMSIGGLMLASTLLRAWGVVQDGPVTDAVFIGLLIGGFLVCVTGFALHRQVTRAGG